ncbi:MAG: DUF1043 family protein [Xanthomonadales bacterium]|nr:DUF1043 family protein [Xanthomonadales bacterium]
MNGMVYIMIGGILGLLLGMLIMYLLQKKGAHYEDTRAVQEKLDAYQEQVEGHFAKTADLIDNLTESYKAVFEHLSDSAESLLTEEQIKNQLANRKSREVTIKYLKGSQQSEDTPDSV